MGVPNLVTSNVPVAVPGLSNVVSLSAGFWHTCAAFPDGTARCWGDNTYGQLGDGTTTAQRSPVLVNGISGVRAVVAGGFHSCALLADSTVRCWGEGDFGELGNGQFANSLTPVKVVNTGMTWTTSDPNVATVSATGLVTAVRAGTATITATDAAGNSGSTTITVRQLFSLTTSSLGDGGGTVTSNPAGINCGTACTASFLSDSQVALSAAPRADSDFTGWTGCDSVSGTTCTVTMSAGRTVTATFMLKRFVLSVTKTSTLLGKGTVTSSPAGINCGSTCSGPYIINTNVTLTAAPDSLSMFNGWTGCDAVNGAQCVVSMTRARSVTANFIGLSVF
jgi:hypothetical protein